MKGTLQIPYGISDFRRIRNEGLYYIDKTNIAAAELDEYQDFVVGNRHYYFSALDFIKRVMENSDPDSANYKLAEATYWYNQAANAYFN